MSLRPTSQCCGALNRRLFGRQDSSSSIWVSEAALATAYDRYCAVSYTFRRHGSSVPGPLESRRRQNKRQMGELTFGQSHGSAPSWGLENLPDLSQWQWQPPTARQFRRRRQEERKLWESVLDWLSTADEEPPSALSSAAAPSFSAAATAVSEASPTVTETLPSPSPGDGSVDPFGLVGQGLESLVRDASLDHTLFDRPAFTEFCRVLRRGLETGRIPGTAICIVIPALTGGLSRALGFHSPSASLDPLKAQLLSVTLDGLDALCAIRTGPTIDNEVWSMLLKETSRLQINSLRIFERIMAKIPSEAVTPLRSGILANIDTFLFAMGHTSTHKSTYVRQANKMAKSCLLTLALPEHRHILQEATERLAEVIRGHKKGYRAMRFCWLQVLARIRDLDDVFFVNACAFLEAGSDVQPMTQWEISHIFLGRQNSCHSVNGILDVYNVLKTSRHFECYSSVSFKFWRTDQARLFKSLCRFLLQLGRQQDILKTLQRFRALVKSDVTPLANLVIGFGHFDLALQVYFRYHRSLFATKKFWNTGFAQDTLNLLAETRSPGAPVDRIIHALKLFPRRNPRPRYYQLRKGRGQLLFYLLKSHRRPKTIRIPQIQKAERAATAFARAPYLSDRKRLRLVMACYHYLQSYGVRLSSRTLEALSHVVTRDLRRGQQGRVTRLRWFLRVLFKEQGRDKMLAAGKKLEDWRQRNLDERRAARSQR